MIDVSETPLRALADAAFSASGGGALSDADYAACLVPVTRASQPVLIMGTVAAVAVHLVVLLLFGRHLVRVHWQGHTDDQLRQMLQGLGVALPSHDALGHVIAGAPRPLDRAQTGVF